MKKFEKFDNNKLNVESESLEYYKFIRCMKFYESHGDVEAGQNRTWKIYYKFLLIQENVVKFYIYDKSERELIKFNYILDTKMSNMAFNQRLKLLRALLQEIAIYKFGNCLEVFDELSRYLYRELFYSINCKHNIDYNIHNAQNGKIYSLFVDNIEEEQRVKDTFKHYLGIQEEYYGLDSKKDYFMLLAIPEEDLSSFKLLWEKFLNGGVKYHFPAKMQILYLHEKITR